MKSINVHENFPFWTVLLSNLGSITTYVLGFIIMYKIGLIISILFLVYILILEYRLIRYHCVNCYYWGKTCGLGKGRISSMFFKRGDMTKFCIKEILWKDLIPDLLITLIPVVTGIILLIIKFDITILFALIIMISLVTAGNGFIRGHLTCKYCKQRALGCPAYNLFDKK